MGKLNTEWKTFRGKVVTLNTIDHQHLSNCYWYMRIVLGIEHEDPQILMYVEELEERFNGQLLPYRPHTKFKLEIDFLKEKGYLQVVVENEIFSKQQIWYRGTRVGEIIQTVI